MYRNHACQVWSRRTYPLPYYSIFDADTLCHTLTSTFDPLTLKVCGTSSVTWWKSVRNLSEVEQSLVELLIILRILAHVVMLWPWPLTSLPWTFTALRVSCISSLYQIWVKSNNTQLSYQLFSAFSRCNFMGGARLTNGSQGCVDWNSLNLARTYGNHSYTRHLFQSLVILLHFQTRAAKSWAMLETMPNFALFDPLWKLEEGSVGPLYQLLKLYLRLKHLKFYP